jgi:hypothetical protein
VVCRQRLVIGHSRKARPLLGMKFHFATKLAPTAIGLVVIAGRLQALTLGG